jgi:hypothetical protein
MKDISERDREIRRMTTDINSTFSTVQNALNELADILKSLDIEWTPPNISLDPGASGSGGGGT